MSIPGKFHTYECINKKKLNIKNLTCTYLSAPTLNNSRIILLIEHNLIYHYKGSTLCTNLVFLNIFQEEAEVKKLLNCEVGKIS